MDIIIISAINSFKICPEINLIQNGYFNKYSIQSEVTFYKLLKNGKINFVVNNKSQISSGYIDLYIPITIFPTFLI